MNQRIYLSPERRPAPHGKFSGYEMYEHDYCCDIAARLTPLLERCGFTVKIASPDKTIYQRVPEAIAWDAGYYLPLHTNASGNDESGSAQGALVLTAGNAESKKASALLYARLTALRQSSRGVREEPSFFELKNAKAPIAYPEIAFHDNPEDARFLMEHRDAIAQALALGVCDYYGIVPPSDETVSLLRRLRALAEQLDAVIATLEKTGAA